MPILLKPRYEHRYNPESKTYWVFDTFPQEFCFGEECISEGASIRRARQMNTTYERSLASGAIRHPERVRL